MLLSKISSSSPFEEQILEESQREAKPLLYIYSPFPLPRGRGIKVEDSSRG